MFYCYCGRVGNGGNVSRFKVTFSESVYFRNIDNEGRAAWFYFISMSKIQRMYVLSLIYCYCGRVYYEWGVAGFDTPV